MRNTIFLHYILILGHLTECIGYSERDMFANLEFDDELDSNYLPLGINFKPRVPFFLKGVYYQKSHLWGLHKCTRRPCNCWIGNCFAYCEWNWCFVSNSKSNRFRLDCDAKISKAKCSTMEWPCKQFC